MKIIRKGQNGTQVDPITKKTITCDCGTKFKLESKSEAKYVISCRDGEYYEVICPICRQINICAADLFQESSVK